MIIMFSGCNFPLEGFNRDDNFDSDSEGIGHEEDDADFSDIADDDSDDDDIPLVEELFLRDFKFSLPLFSPDSAWNQSAAGASVLPESDQQILITYRVMLGDISSLEGYDEAATNWPFMDISFYDWTIPIFLVGDGEQEVWICDDLGVVGWPSPKFGIDEEGGPVIVPAPDGIVRPAGPEHDNADAWLVLYDPDTSIAYDYFAAYTQRDADCREFEGGSTGNKILQAGAVDFFDVRGDGANPDTYSSARAHGTPLLAGLILPEDIESGEISHALSFAIPGPRNLSRDPSEPLLSDYFYPASTTETDFYNTDPNALAAGQRIRLKKTLYGEDGEIIHEDAFAPITNMFLASLRNYGAYLVDNSGGFTFYAEDVHTGSLNLSDDEVNVLIGEPPGTPLPPGMTKWQIVIEKLGNELEILPIAVSPGDDQPNPKTEMIEFSNFEVVEPAFVP